jgi:uncharacterized membrane protein YdjX (TVP38/TMEM64 family)
MIAITLSASGHRTRASSTGGASGSHVPLTNVKPVVNTLYAARTAVIAATRQVPRRRMAAILAVAVILVALVLLVPLPSALQLRDWAKSVGPWFPLAFLAAHVVVTVLPFPRTAFTLSAGLLFGPLLGIGIALLASTLSAVIALWLVRAAGWQLNELVRHPRVDALNARLERRSWPTVLSMRLIPLVPFSVLNYAAGAAAVRTLPYTLATVVGLLPGTAAIVVFGDALTGNVSPLLLVLSTCTAAIGFAGLLVEIRSQRRHHRAARDEPTPAVTP